MGKKTKNTTMRFTEADLAAIAIIRERYGCISDTAAVRLALAWLSHGEGSPTPSPLQKERHSHPVA